MPSRFSDSENFEFNEVEISEQELDNLGSSEFYDQESGHRRRTRQRTRVHRVEKNRQKSKTKNKYGWAFFLFSLFTGLGITATIGEPLGLFMGLGIGFLFFVDPIYEKVMSILDRL
jgi:hypothetical protein